MQADFVAERRRRRLVLTFGLVLGLAAAAATYFLISRPSGGTGGPVATPVPQTIVVAAVDIKGHSQILAEMLTTLQVPENPVFNGVASDPAEVVGSVALVNIAKGQALQTSLYSGGNPSGVVILAPGETVSPDSPIWRAVSVQVPNERAVGGLVSAGDHVDLIVTLSPQLYDPTGGPCVIIEALGGSCLKDPDHVGPLAGTLYSGPTTKITLQDLEVLQTDPETTVYVLKVTEAEAEQIAHVQSSGDNEFTLSLRPVADTRPVDPATYGQTTNTLINEYGFPIPHMIDVSASASPGALPTPSAAVSPTPGPSPTP
jgi:Flp pilus assembly protein CpaB